MEAGVLKREMMIYARFLSDRESLLNKIDFTGSSFFDASRLSAMNSNLNKILVCQREKIVLCGGYVANVMAEVNIPVKSSLPADETYLKLKQKIYGIDVRFRSKFPFGAEISAERGENVGEFSLVIRTHHTLIDQVIDMVSSTPGFNEVFSRSDFVQILPEHQHICGLNTTSEISDYINQRVAPYDLSASKNPACNDLEFK